MIFAGISGSAAADTSAIGSIMMPAMIRAATSGLRVRLQASPDDRADHPAQHPDDHLRLHDGLSIGQLSWLG